MTSPLCVSGGFGGYAFGLGFGGGKENGKSGGSGNSRYGVPITCIGSRMITSFCIEAPKASNDCLYAEGEESLVPVVSRRANPFPCCQHGMACHTCPISRNAPD